jgi:uncharacterized protein YndB with AHSA1/START domain
MANDAPTPTTAAATADRTLVVERIFKAPPERVFRAWSDHKVLVKWWGTDDYQAPDPQIDFRVGGAWRSAMVGPNGEAHTVSGVYREIEPPKRLVMTWGWEQADGSRGHETVVEVSFEPAPGGTRMRLVQSLFETPKSRDGHDFGWASSFARLDRVLG